MKPYELDPQHQAAHDAYVRDYPTASAGLTARANAAATMHRMQAAYEADPSQFRQYEAEAWAATEAAKLPPLTQTEIGVVAAIARQIGEPECTCILGRIDEHKRAECTCTTTVMDCAVHADSDIGQSEAETVTQYERHRHGSP